MRIMMTWLEKEKCKSIGSCGGVGLIQFSHFCQPFWILGNNKYIFGEFLELGITLEIF
jgi:hypothetical protein